MVKGGGLCLTAVQAEGKREAEAAGKRRKGRREEGDDGASRVKEKEGSGRREGERQVEPVPFNRRSSTTSVQTLGTHVLVCRRIIMVKRVRKHPNILRRRRGYESISCIYTYVYIWARLYMQVEISICIRAYTCFSRCGISLSTKLLVGVGMLIPWLSPPAAGSPIRPSVCPSRTLDFSAR